MGAFLRFKCCIFYLGCDIIKNVNLTKRDIFNKVMATNKKKEITNLEFLKSINRSFSRVEKKMATKTELLGIENGLAGVKTDLEQVQTDLRSLKQETRDNFEEVNKKIDDLTETMEDVTSNHEDRIEVLERKAGI